MASEKNIYRQKEKKMGHANQKTDIFLIGDSTMSQKDDLNIPERGWGMVIYQYFDNNIQFHNFAANGRSTKSFIDEGRWKKVLNLLKSGDYVFIQFGHNDEKMYDPLRYTHPDKEYRENLKLFVTSSRKCGANPVLMSSICRRNFDEQGNLLNTHGTYPEAVRKTAEELSVPFIDMELKTRKLILDHGVEDSNKLFVRIEPGLFESFPEGLIDNSHLSIYGATLIAGLAVEGIKDLGLAISRNIE